MQKITFLLFLWSSTVLFGKNGITEFIPTLQNITSSSSITEDGITNPNCFPTLLSTTILSQKDDPVYLNGSFSNAPYSCKSTESETINQSEYFSPADVLGYFTALSSYTDLEIKDDAMRMYGIYPYASTAYKRTFSKDENIFIEYKAENVRQHVGFSKIGAYAYEGILNQNGVANIVKGSVFVEKNITTYNEGAIFRVEKVDQTISYYKDGVKFYEEPYSLGDNFYIGISSSAQSGNIEGIKVGQITKTISSRKAEVKIQEIPTFEESVSFTTVYPNPTNGLINVKAKKEIKAWKIVSMSGKMIGHEELRLPKENFTVNIGNQSEGLYVMQIIYTDGTSESKKIIKR